MNLKFRDETDKLIGSTSSRQAPTEWSEKNRDEIIAKRTRIRNTINIAALGTEVWIGEVIEHHHPEEKQHQDDRNGDGEKAELLDSVPLADSDVGHKDEGGQDPEYEPADLGEVVDVREGAQDCGTKERKTLLTVEHSDKCLSE